MFTILLSGLGLAFFFNYAGENPWGKAFEFLSFRRCRQCRRSAHSVY